MFDLFTGLSLIEEKFYEFLVTRRLELASLVMWDDSG